MLEARTANAILAHQLKSRTSRAGGAGPSTSTMSTSHSPNFSEEEKFASVCLIQILLKNILNILIKPFLWKQVKYDKFIKKIYIMVVLRLKKKAHTVYAFVELFILPRIISNCIEFF